ncbi:hypothetical protein PVAP13_1KG275420 [Panicum virgatum]|uniref:Uncharacterized protein n=1 Tax=Panicum virgatum TaxID=38727 RepID=A0A8T0XFD2_PANVG|nr:hypothetical protein PVAP13_1KG275420 [Panicum virgatum]
MYLYRCWLPPSADAEGTRETERCQFMTFNCFGSPEVHQRSTKCDARGSPRLASSCASVVARDARSWASCYAPHGSTTCTAEC